VCGIPQAEKLVSSLNVDKEGFLRNLSDWDIKIAEELARQSSIELTDAHWEIIHIVREYHAEYNLTPVTRVLAKIVREQLGSEKASSVYLMGLFTGKPTKLIAKIAGLPKPNNCD